MNKSKLLKGACLVAATSMLPLSQAAIADVTISGWLNEGIQFYDDGVSSDAVATTDNGTTLGSRITFAGSTEVYTGLTAGFDLTLEPHILNTPLIFSNQTTYGDTNNYTHFVSVLGSALYVSGAWGKVTVGTQSMPTDNIAVLEDPSLTLWSGISPIFRGNGFNIKGSGDDFGGPNVNFAIGEAVWGNFLNCFGSGLRGAGGIGIDCNGIYRTGIRYDLPAFGPVSIAIGYANDDIYDISAKYKGDFGRIKASIALGYSINQGINTSSPTAGAFTGTGAFATPGALGSADFIHFSEAETFQIQAGLMDPVTGLFGSIAYQNEDADLVAGTQALVDANAAAVFGAITPAVTGAVSDESDAWWLKVGIKKKWFAAGDTSISFDYGQYNDQYGAVQAAVGVDGSEVERIGVAIDQYFGSNLIIYGKWEQLDLDVDQTAAAAALWGPTGFAIPGGGIYGNTEELDTFTLGAVVFF